MHEHTNVFSTCRRALSMMIGIKSWIALATSVPCSKIYPWNIDESRRWTRHTVRSMVEFSHLAGENPQNYATSMSAVERVVSTAQFLAPGAN